MTSSSRDFETAIQRADDGEGLRALIGHAAWRLRDLEVEAVTGAGCGERSPERRTRRDGDRDRSWQTRAGKVDPQVPKLPQGACFPSLLEPPGRARRPSWR